MLLSFLRWFFICVTVFTVVYAVIILRVVYKPVLDLSKPFSVYPSSVAKTKLLHEYISQANESIVCSLYNLTDKTIIDLMNKKASEGLSIDVSTDKKNKRKLIKQLDSSIRIHTPKKSGLMHEKIVHIDDEWVYISTGNATLESHVVDENISIVYSPLWCKSEAIALSLYELPQHRSEVLNVIKSAIDEATLSIQIRMFYLTHKPIVNALINAAERDVEVSILCDKKSSRYTIPLFENTNISPIYRNELGWLHSKICLIDQRLFFMGSLNWTKSGFKSNQENLLIIDIDSIDLVSRERIINLFT